MKRYVLMCSRVPVCTGRYGLTLRMGDEMFVCICIPPQVSAVGNMILLPMSLDKRRAGLALPITRALLHQHQHLYKI